jgi:hypothetical protein
MRQAALAVFILTLPVAVGAGEVPPGFRSIFNGKNLAGWHISQASRHGNSKAWFVKDGALFGGQDTPGNGGVLLTDRKYRNFEIYMEIKPDWGCDGGLFLRSNEEGQAYQVQINYLPNDFIGGLSAEGLGPNRTTTKLAGAPGWEKVWKKDEWNALRARIQGDIPHIIVWLNGVKITDWTDTENRLAGGVVDGMIGLQVHASKGRWRPGGYHRFRNIALRTNISAQTE